MNTEQALIHLAVLGKREKYQITAKNHKTGNVANPFLIKDEVIKYAESMNQIGYCVWISLNPKTKDEIEGVTALADFWLDIDRPKATKDSQKPATKEELEEALIRAGKLQTYIEKEYNAIGLLAYSGNGFHLHFPLPITLIESKQAKSVNSRVRAFAKHTAKQINQEIDSTYDINRKTTLIGSQNLKIPGSPLETKWDEIITSGGLEKALSFVETAREQNKTLLEAILTTPSENSIIPITSNNESKIIPELDKILNRNPTFKDVFSGLYEKYNFVSRSEAEQYLVVELMRYGYGPAKIRETMKNSKVGKWNDPRTQQQYREHTIKKAANFIREEALKSNPEAQERDSQADRLVKLCLNEKIELFFDQHNTPYAKVTMPFDLRYCDICDTSETLARNETIKNQINDKAKEDNIDTNLPKVTETAQTPQYRNIVVPIGSSQFKQWLSFLMWQFEEKAPGNDSLNSAVTVLKGKAQQEGKQYTLFNRVAPALDGIWLDMADYRNRAIKITANGWEIVDDVPLIFRRYSHQQPLTEPNREGDAWKFLDLTNIPKDENTKLAVLCSVASYFIPLISHPAIIVSGAQGSAKSWFLKLIKRIIDPSSIELLALPRDERELAQQLEHHWIAPYDNLSSLPIWASDMFCRAVTGAGIAVRKLYTDDEDTILNFKRCILLNGINVAAQKGDLLDRAILLALNSIDAKNRKTEAELNALFEAELPRILGGFLNVVSKALSLFDSVKLEGYQRLADFNRYGCAIALGLGKNQTDFELAYAQKVEQQNQEALNADNVALAILKFCQSKVKNRVLATAQGVKIKDCWQDQPATLYKELAENALTLGIDVKAKGWPKSPNALTRRINLVGPALKAVGVEITNFEGNPRQIRIEAQKYVFDEELKNIAGYKTLETLVLEAKCWLCNTKKTLTYYVTTFEKETHNICNDCAEKVAKKLLEAP